MIIRADPSFFLIFTLLSSHPTSGYARYAINHPITNGMKNPIARTPITINKIVPRRLKKRLAATFQYGLLSVFIPSASSCILLLLTVSPEHSGLGKLPDFLSPLLCFCGKRNHLCAAYQIQPFSDHLELF